MSQMRTCDRGLGRGIRLQGRGPPKIAHQLPDDGFFSRRSPSALDSLQTWRSAGTGLCIHFRGRMIRGSIVKFHILSRSSVGRREN